MYARVGNERAPGSGGVTVADELPDKDLIDRYVYAVLAHVPNSIRGKVGTELRTRIAEEAPARAVRPMRWM